eukprot:sb/3478455/
MQPLCILNQLIVRLVVTQQSETHCFSFTKCKTRHLFSHIFYTPVQYIASSSDSLPFVKPNLLGIWNVVQRVREQFENSQASAPRMAGRQVSAETRHFLFN